jgi:hypothetical protein
MRYLSNLASRLLIVCWFGFMHCPDCYAQSVPDPALAAPDSAPADVAPETVTSPPVEAAVPAAPTDSSTAAAPAASPSEGATPTAETPETTEPVDERINEPWDFSPYRILVWVISDNSRVNAETLADPVREFLDRQFASIWRVTFETAPPAVASVANRSLADLDFATLSAADPVIAVKRTDPDAARMRSMADLPEYVEKILCTPNRATELKQRIADVGDESLNKVTRLLTNIDGDAFALQGLWAETSTEAMLISRGMALTLTKPEAKLITPPVSGLVSDSAERFDKIFIVNVTSAVRPTQIEVIELDTLMQAFGPVVKGVAIDEPSLVSTIASSMIKAFAPTVRIDNAGQKNAVGLLRAGGLILDKNSPAWIKPGDVLIPMVRKNDRNGKPIQIGPLTWAYLLAVEIEMSSFGAPAGLDVQLDDRIAVVNGDQVWSTAVVAKTLEDTNLKSVPIEIKRGENSVKLELERTKFEALRPKYFGFAAADQGSGERAKLAVTAVYKDSPADGKLEVGDAIVSVAKTAGLDAATLRQLVVTVGEENKAVEFMVKRGEETQTVSIEPIEQTDLARRQSSIIEMDFHAGMPAGLQGRSNSRTFRMASKARPYFDNTMIRMHVRGAADEPLIGYEIYEKALNSKEMTFLGRTDWNGRIWLEKTENPLRLLYVKNGGAVLARLPIAYIRGVQNAIVDLIAIRELLGARIRLRLKKGEMKEAETLLEQLRAEPSNETIADDMGKKQTDYLKILGNGNANQRKMIDQMFTTTRELLSKHINQKMINDLEDDFIAAKKNGGKLPEPPPEDDGTTVARPTPEPSSAEKNKAPATTEAPEPAPTT